MASLNIFSNKAVGFTHATPGF